jgi:hypothetical protein
MWIFWFIFLLNLSLFTRALKLLIWWLTGYEFGRIRVAAVAAASSVARVPLGQRSTGHKPSVSWSHFLFTLSKLKLEIESWSLCWGSLYCMLKVNLLYVKRTYFAWLQVKVWRSGFPPCFRFSDLDIVLVNFCETFNFLVFYSNIYVWFIITFISEMMNPSIHERSFFSGSLKMFKNTLKIYFRNHCSTIIIADVILWNA